MEVPPSRNSAIPSHEAKINWSTYFIDTMRPKFGGGLEDYSGTRPSVVAGNSEGTERVIAVCKKLKEAMEKALAIESDFGALGAAAWCQRYGVPQGFVN